MKEVVTLADGHEVVLHYGSWLAHRMAGRHGAVTLSARHIFVAAHWITAKGLAHEVGHTRQARRYGWLYLPWVLWHYAISGYEQSKPEREADAYMDANWRYFLNHGPVPSWVRD